MVSLGGAVGVPLESGGGYRGPLSLSGWLRGSTWSWGGGCEGPLGLVGGLWGSSWFWGWAVRIPLVLGGL